ncbi:hypothetical protein L1987_28130 [Smallanthus sonchifolius]|uniref:Uncharacterized protein n=1 Tax=Smallanthus sonchifolius TaxID=185202 RepID=A0ACB9ID65_9ASTR|nr:hypothetical protein L1987_28130 [Smallanthus sonchifolius]
MGDLTLKEYTDKFHELALHMPREETHMAIWGRFSLGLVSQSKENTWPVQPCINSLKEETMPEHPSEGRQDGRVVEQAKNKANRKQGELEEKKTYRGKFSPRSVATTMGEVVCYLVILNVESAGTDPRNVKQISLKYQHAMGVEN